MGQSKSTYILFDLNNQRHDVGCARPLGNTASRMMFREEGERCSTLASRLQMSDSSSALRKDGHSSTTALAMFLSSCFDTCHIATCFLKGPAVTTWTKQWSLKVWRISSDKLVCNAVLC